MNRTIFLKRYCECEVLSTQIAHQHLSKKKGNRELKSEIEKNLNLPPIYKNLYSNPGKHSRTVHTHQPYH